MVTRNTTLDGVVEAAGGWSAPQDDGADASDRLDVVREHRTGRSVFLVSVFLVGRRTSEDVRGFWPHRTADTTGISAHLDAVEKAVVSRTLTEPGWANTTVLAGDPVEEVRRLVDEYRLFVSPPALGRGRRLFPEGTDVRLAATGSRTFRSGATLLTHRPA